MNLKDIKNNLPTYVICFFLYSVVGWCYEVFLEVVVYRWGFSNRGVLFGPYTPVYGFGALTFILFVYPLIYGKETKRKLAMIPVVFLLCMGIATGIELATSYILEYTMGSWAWDYLRYPYNFQGRIALSPSVRFGFGGLLFLYVLQPLFDRLCSSLKSRVSTVSAVILCVLFVDCGYSFFLSSVV